MRIEWYIIKEHRPACDLFCPVYSVKGLLSAHMTAIQIANSTGHRTQVVRDPRFDDCPNNDTPVGTVIEYKEF